MSHLPRDGRTRGVIIVAALAAAATLVSGQQPPQQPPRFRAGTNFVQVDAYPTKDGAPLEDLSAADFEIAEDGTPQKIETFEHIVVEPAPQAARVDPGSPTLANALAADPHRRVFVIFLDNANVTIEGSYHIKEPLIELLTRVLGPDDLVGVMTPDMGPDQIAFGRKTDVIENALRNNWPWGRKNSIMLDEQEQKYDTCFPPVAGERSPSALATALIQRRRERIVLDSLNDLVHHMSAVREGRTAVVAVTEGWILYSPDQALTNLRKDPYSGGTVDPVPGSPQPPGVGPGGTLTLEDPQRQPFGTIQRECDRDRMELAMADDNKYFRDILGDANRANVSFYPIDPRGLHPFDSDIGPAPSPPLTVDHAILRNRIESLHVLALNTDGIALVENNDLRGQLRRLAADLTSYYLMGYYSTNTKLDGTFRRIKVRVKRPGVMVRARNGYRAATDAQVAAARTDAAAPAAAPNAAITDALGTLERTARTGHSFGGSGEPIVFHRGPTTGNQLVKAEARVFSRSERVHLELQAAVDVPLWTGALLDRTGKRTPIPVAVSERTDPAMSQRWFLADVTLAPLGPGDYVIEMTRSAGDPQKLLTGIRVTQ